MGFEKELGTEKIGWHQEGNETRKGFEGGGKPKRLYVLTVFGDSKDCRKGWNTRGCLKGV